MINIYFNILTLDSSLGTNHCIRFEDIKKQNSKLPYSIECDNVPFICKNIQTFVCHRGKKYEKCSNAKAVSYLKYIIYKYLISLM